ncbi:MAG: TonB-dependent receptor [Bacteroidales bacterium]|nr:TonB-dependent receptor [Bacteroidales bacterium]
MKKNLLLLLFTFILASFSVVAQERTCEINGVIRDKATNETLPGTNILVEGTSIGTSSDFDGKFTLKVPAGDLKITAQFIGYENQTVTVSLAANQKLTLNFSLKSSATELEELVVVGYGVQQKSVVTGAISQVRAKDLENMSISRIEHALQGRTTGLTIASSSGQPGAASTVRVRGTTTINQSDPLFVVDGVPVDNGGIDYLNPSDIESIEVLKDGASAAIYGTRAANGVILVTTKKGKSGAMRVNYNAFLGTQAPAHKLDMLNATEYAILRNEAVPGVNPVLPYDDPASFGEGTDWQGTIFNNHAMIQNHELSISGGNDQSTYYSSFGYLDQEGVVATSISNYKRINLRFNATHKVNDWLRFGTNLGYSHIKSMGSLNPNSEYGGPLASAINLDPITPAVITDTAVSSHSPYDKPGIVLDENGNPYGISDKVAQEMSNPLAYIQTRQGNFGWSDNFVGNAYAEIEPIKGLKLRSDLGSKMAFWGDENFTPVYYLNAANSNSVNKYSLSSSKSLIWNLENTASYTRNFGLHHITALAGTSAIVEKGAKEISIVWTNLPVNNFYDATLNYNIVDSLKIGNGRIYDDDKLASIFGRIIYNYNEKYLFTGIIRRDGSSKFGSNNKFGYFPSVSVGWVITKESFWPVNDIVNFLKIRGSYGVNGNNRIINFGYLATIGSNRNYTFGYDGLVVGYSPNAPSNQDLEWEETSQLNFGFEATLLEDFRITFDLYSKNTTGMLQPIILPKYVGAIDDPIGNVASMTNKGVELELGYHKQLHDLIFDIKGNCSYLKNEITDLGIVEFREGANFQSSAYPISRLTVGHPIGAFYGYQVLDIFQSIAEVQHHKDKDGNMIQPNAKPGDFRYADLNNDGKIDADDRTFIGDPTPTWTYGFTVSASFKGFDLLVFGQGVAGNDVYNGLHRLDIQDANWTTEALDRWTETNHSETFPRIVNGDPNRNFSRPSTFQLSSGAYFRIKTLQIGYTLPKNITNKIKLQNLRFYVSSNNLATFTKYKGFDPEIGGGSFGIDRGVYPQARSFMAGINVTI